jgi:hypothetical protein
MALLAIVITGNRPVSTEFAMNSKQIISDQEPLTPPMTSINTAHMGANIAENQDLNSLVPKVPFKLSNRTFQFWRFL